MSTTMDPVFTEGVEREMEAIGTGRSQLQRHQRRTRTASIVGGSLALVGVLTGAAIISGLPGQTTVTPFGEPVTGSFTGTATVDLGPVPTDAEQVVLDITCTEGGKIEVPTNPWQGDRGSGSVSWDCSDPIRVKPTVHIDDVLLPADGATTITITADPGTPWSVVARYATSSTTPWGVNAHGETHGVPNENGIPDLVSAQATNGEIGYTRESEQFAFEGEGYLPVYTSDGETVIGWFPIGDPSTLGEPPALEE